MYCQPEGSTHFNFLKRDRYATIPNIWILYIAAFRGNYILQVPKVLGNARHKDTTIIRYCNDLQIK